jgi:hypothetical protein
MGFFTMENLHAQLYHTTTAVVTRVQPSDLSWCQHRKFLLWFQGVGRTLQQLATHNAAE